MSRILLFTARATVRAMTGDDVRRKAVCGGLGLATSEGLPINTVGFFPINEVRGVGEPKGSERSPNPDDTIALSSGSRMEGGLAACPFARRSSEARASSTRASSAAPPVDMKPRSDAANAADRVAHLMIGQSAAEASPSPRPLWRYPFCAGVPAPLLPIGVVHSWRCKKRPDPWDCAAQPLVFYILPAAATTRLRQNPGEGQSSTLARPPAKGTTSPQNRRITKKCALPASEDR